MGGGGAEGTTMASSVEGAREPSEAPDSIFSLNKSKLHFTESSLKRRSKQSSLLCLHVRYLTHRSGFHKLTFTGPNNPTFGHLNCLCCLKNGVKLKIAVKTVLGLVGFFVRQQISLG